MVDNPSSQFVFFSLIVNIFVYGKEEAEITYSLRTAKRPILFLYQFHFSRRLSQVPCPIGPFDIKSVVFHHAAIAAGKFETL